MARRDLARTVIEGGRYNYNRWERRQSHAEARATAHAWLRRLTVDDAAAGASAPPPLRPVHRAFYDKLAPLYRWLHAQVGRRWDDVRADVAARFDVRTIAGQHIVYDHLLFEVEPRWPRDPRYQRFVIDPAGVLRHGPRWQRRRKRPPRPAWAPPWSAARVDGAWWWIGDRPCGRCVVGDRCRYGHLRIDGARYHFTAATRIRRLTPTEVGRLTSSPPEVRALLAWAGPTLAPEAAALSRQGRP
ncbi:MAG: hypothetical protein JNK64_40445 [Myxococcales bacterium]|nr:hypothetical protein [Myxococcales bacterium]